MATLFASDLHLDSESPWAIDAFIAFLEGRLAAPRRSTCSATCSKCGWAMTTTNSDNARTCAALRALTASGVPAYAIHGNRDFLLGESFAARHRRQTTARPGAGGSLRRADAC
jgi:UDP-2,3-diacylglucosamine hydrolase